MKNTKKVFSAAMAIPLAMTLILGVGCSSPPPPNESENQNTTATVDREVAFGTVNVKVKAPDSADNYIGVHVVGAALSNKTKKVDRTVPLKADGTIATTELNPGSYTFTIEKAPASKTAGQSYVLPKAQIVQVEAGKAVDVELVLEQKPVEEAETLNADTVKENQAVAQQTADAPEAAISNVGNAGGTNNGSSNGGSTPNNAVSGGGNSSSNGNNGNNGGGSSTGGNGGAVTPAPTPTPTPTPDPTPAPPKKWVEEYSQYWVVTRPGYTEPVYKEVVYKQCDQCGYTCNDDRTMHGHLISSEGSCWSGRTIFEAVPTGEYTTVPEEGYWESYVSGGHWE